MIDFYTVIRDIRLCILGLSVVAGVELAAASNSNDTVTHELQEVVVTEQSARNRIKYSKLGSENLELTKLSLAPKMFGEADIIKSITLLPGVNAETAGAGGFEVRGGNAYQNLVTMDGMTLYNPSHLMGIFSTFNEDAMSRAVLHKGPIPANLGGASSSVLETTMHSGDMERHNYSATIGLLNAKVAVNGPIVKDKLSFTVAARRSYVDMFLKMVPQYRSTVMNFFDVNGKIRYKVNEKNIIDASFFASRDNLAISRLMDMRWGNIAGSVNWNSYLSDKTRNTLTISHTTYDTDMGSTIMGANQSLTQYIQSTSLNERLVYTLSDNHVFDAGLRSELLRVKSGDMIIRDLRQREIRSGWENNVWLGYDGAFGSKFNLSLGVRGSLFSAISAPGFHCFEALNEESPDFNGKTYFHVEPRGSIKYSVNDCHNIKIGAGVSTQNIHGVRSTFTTFPFDRYAITSAGVRPEITTLYSIGYAGMTKDGSLDWSVEGYYKKIKNVYDYKDGVTMFSRMNLESLLLMGKGRSYGMEVMLRKNFGNLTGWVAYTLSKTETRIPGINNNQWYKASNDRRNDIAIVALYSFNDKWNVSASWTYSSGRPLTAPDEKYKIDGMTCYYYTERNSYKTPASHRLDLGANYTRRGKKFTSIWSAGIYNAYCYYSPFVVYFEDDSTKPSGTRAVQRSLFGIVPSISYTIQF